MSIAPSLYHRATTGPAWVQARYGTARGLARLALSRAARAAGRYDPFEHIEWGAVRRLVFVCAGNICRSPYAEALAARRGFPTASAAMYGMSGHAADPGAQTCALLSGFDLGAHRSRTMEEVAVRAGDLLVAMEPGQAVELVRLYVSAQGVQITLLGLWSRPRRPHLHDPYGLGAAYFRTCYEVIESGVAAMLAKVKQ